MLKEWQGLLLRVLEVGIWFAAKVGGVWELVWDGNGSIYCSDLVNYPDYPIDMIPECYDEIEGKIVNR